MTQILKVRFLLHGLFWLVFTYLSSSFLVGLVPFGQIVQRLLVVFSANALLVYGNMFGLVPALFQKGKYGLYLLSALLFSLPVLAFRWWLEPLVMSGTRFAQIFPTQTYPIILVSSSLAMLVFSLGYRLAEDYFISVGERNELEKSRLEAETNFLRAQINPHFLFNTLNNLYALTLMKSDKAPDAILKLSHLMRFMLYDAEQKEILLTKEVQYIRDFIDLELLRFEEIKDVRFDVDADLESIRVAPLLLIPLVENCFKYSNLLTDSQPFIHLSLLKNGERMLVFKARNSLDSKRKEEHQPGGIGLNNLNQRLSLLYPLRHTLDIDTQVNSFTITLSIQI